MFTDEDEKEILTLQQFLWWDMDTSCVEAEIICGMLVSQWLEDN